MAVLAVHLEQQRSVSAAVKHPRARAPSPLKVAPNPGVKADGAAGVPYPVAFPAAAPQLTP